MRRMDRVARRSCLLRVYPETASGTAWRLAPLTVGVVEERRLKTDHLSIVFHFRRFQPL